MTSTGCHSVKIQSTTAGYYLAAMVTDLCRHLTNDWREAQHTVYAMLLSNYKFDTTLNSYNGKCDVS